MAKRSDQIKREIERLLALGKGKSHFTQNDANELWFWQGHMRVNIKNTLSLELPAVYGPPKAIPVNSNSQPPQQNIQIWNVETEPGINVPLEIHLPRNITAQPSGFVLKIFEQLDEKQTKNFCEEITSSGLACSYFSIRTSNSFDNDIYKLAQIYLDSGRCLSGVIATDIIRVVDYIEHQFQIEGEPIVLIASGKIASAILACSAIDQRISGIILDYAGDTDSLMSFTGKAPFFRDPYLHLGANPWLVLAQCCVPRPIAILNLPENINEPLPVNKMLSFAEQLEILQNTYKSAGKENNLYIIDKSVSVTTPEIIKRFFT